MINKIKKYIDNENILKDYILQFNVSTLIFILYSIYALISLITKSHISILNYVIIILSLGIDIYAIINIELNSKFVSKEQLLIEENLVLNTNHTLA